MKRKLLRAALHCVLAVFVAIVLVIVFQFTPSGQNAVVPLPASPLFVDSPAFLQAFASSTGSAVESNGPVETISDGDAFRADLLSAIAAASSSILIEDYPWDNGTWSGQIFSALTAAARRGVSVWIILDAFGGARVPEDWIEGLQNAGGHVAVFHPFNILDPLAYDGRVHARAFVFDEETAFTGGAGLADAWVEPTDGEGTWADLMFQVHGAMAESLAVDFAEIWKASVTDTASLPPFAVISLEDSRVSFSTAQFGKPSAFTLSLSSPALTASSSAQYVSVLSMPGNGSPDGIESAFLLSVDAARKNVYIENPFIIFDRPLLEALEEKARAGIDVRILSPGPITSAPLIQYAFHAQYAELLSAGVRLYEYQPSMIHSKMMTVDGEWSLVGSANLDNRSRSINAEDVIGVLDPALAENLNGIFMTDASSSKEFTLAEWQKEYSWFDRLVSDFSLLFERQM